MVTRTAISKMEGSDAVRFFLIRVDFGASVTISMCGGWLGGCVGVSQVLFGWGGGCILKCSTESMYASQDTYQVAVLISSYLVTS